MIFSSKAFLIFLPIVLLLYHIQTNRTRKYAFLLAASWLFYMWWSVWYIWVIWFCTIIDYYAGRMIEATSKERDRRRWLMLSVVGNLGLLFFFKYTVFFLDNTLALARWCGFEVPTIVVKIALPLGISFHTFQGISYTVDVYRRQIPAVKSFLDYALFVAFFPQLAAGPIVRASEFLPQMTTPPRVTTLQIVDGLHWFLLGLFKKLVIGDRLAEEIVGPVFANPTAYDAYTHRWATVAWAVQIYCDFSGYSDMAIGCAKWFGFELPRNFNYPYLATSITDFWRRWHMSLSTWLRDYLYYSIGGSHCSPMRTNANLMVVFLLCGLWHGATWNWLAYGLYMGLLMCIHRMWTIYLKGLVWAERMRTSVPWLILALGVTWMQLGAGLILVRMESWGGCWLMLQSWLTVGNHLGKTLVPTCVPMLVALVVFEHAIGGGLRGRLGSTLEWPAVVRAAMYVVTLAMVVILSPGVGKQFIYFDF